MKIWGMGSRLQNISKPVKTNVFLFFWTNVWRKLVILTVSIRGVVILVSAYAHKGSCFAAVVKVKA